MILMLGRILSDGAGAGTEYLLLIANVGGSDIANATGYLHPSSSLPGGGRSPKAVGCAFMASLQTYGL